MRILFWIFIVAFALLAPAYCPAGPPSRETAAQSQKPAEPIDINRATAEDFATLPGIGPELARRIVAHREKHGPFRRVEDLLIIKGMGRKKWRAIRDYVRVEK